MKIERGIITEAQNNSVIARISTGDIPVCKESLLHEYYERNKILGVIISKQLRILYIFKLKSGSEIFGFLCQQTDQSIAINHLPDFDKRNLRYHFFYRIHHQFEEIEITKDEIKEITLPKITDNLILGFM